MNSRPDYSSFQAIAPHIYIAGLRLPRSLLAVRLSSFHFRSRLTDDQRATSFIKPPNIRRERKSGPSHIKDVRRCGRSGRPNSDIGAAAGVSDWSPPPSGPSKRHSHGWQNCSGNCRCYCAWRDPVSWRNICPTCTKPPFISSVIVASS
jgi:hypothetical protein